MIKIVIFITCLLLNCSRLQAKDPKSCRGDVICDDEESDGPVCGSDGITYASRCDYGNAACKASQSGTALRIWYSGKCLTLTTPCNELLIARCPHASSDAYVCGSDGQTYNSECAIAQARCKNLQNPNNTIVLDIDHQGSCEKITNASRQVDCSQYFSTGSGSIAVEGGASVPLHPAACPRNFAPVCSLTGHTYSNECSFCHSSVLRHSITASNMTVYISHDGVCRHISSSSILG